MIFKTTILSILGLLTMATPSHAAMKNEINLDHNVEMINKINFELPTTLHNTNGVRLASMASWYGPGFYGNRTACGQVYNSTMVSAAHKYLPCGTRVRVTNRNNGKSVVVTINDRGPFVAGRVLDLSNAAAKRIRMKSSGVVPIKMEVLN